MTDDDEHIEQTLGEAMNAAAGVAEGFGALVAGRKALIDGGFSPEVADAIILTALQAATK